MKIVQTLTLRKRASKLPLSAIGIATSLVVLVVIVGVTFAFVRPSRQATARGTVPGVGGPLILAGMDRDNAQWINARLRGVSVSRGEVQAGPSTVMLSIPVTPRACRRLASTISASCGSERATPINNGGPIAIEMRPYAPSVEATVSFLEAQQLTLSNTPLSGQPDALGSWTAEPVARVVILRISCDDPAPLTLIIPPRRTAAICSASGPKLLLKVAVSGDVAPDLALNGLELLQVAATGERGTVSVDSGQLSTGETETSLNPADVVTIESGEGVELNVTAPGQVSSSELRMHASTAESASVGDSEKIPTLFERFDEVLLNVLLTFIGLLVGLWLARFQRAGKLHP